MPRATPIPDDSSADDDHEYEGLSLEELGKTYAQLLGKGEVPYADSESTPTEETAAEHDPIGDEAVESDACPISPLTILEAILFVGHPNNESLSPERIANLMRGVRPSEIDQFVQELNEIYRVENHAMEIVSMGGGYRMQLAEDLHRVRDRMYGKTKETRLNQDAIDCLSLVAYQPGITREDLEKQWNHPAGSILNMLVRRNLLELQRDDKTKKGTHRYFPTKRMLQLFGLSSLEELPHVEDSDP